MVRIRIGTKSVKEMALIIFEAHIDNYYVYAIFFAGDFFIFCDMWLKILNCISETPLSKV